jgi:hypothetical protein
MVAHGKEAIPFVVCSLTFLTYNLTFDVRRRSNMPVETVLDQPWTRKHDLPGSPLITAAPKTQYPTLLEDLIDICRTRAPDERLRAAGSHWALSDAAISDHTFIETHDPLNVQKAMGRTLYEVIPGCMKQERLDSMGGGGWSGVAHSYPSRQAHLSAVRRA